MVSVAQLVSIAGSAMVTLAVEHGFGRHVWDINERMVPKVIMYDYVAQSVGLSGGTIGRIAFIVFVIGLLGIMRSHRIILWVLVCLQVIVNMMFIVIIFLQCPGHASAIWQHPGQAKCWDPHVQAYYGYFQGCKDILSASSIIVVHRAKNRARIQRSTLRRIFTSQSSLRTCSGI